MACWQLWVVCCGLQVAHGFRPPFPNLTARFAQGAKDAKKIFLSNRVTVSREGLSDSLRFDKSLDPAGNHIHPKCEISLRSLRLCGSRSGAPTTDFGPLSFRFPKATRLVWAGMEGTVPFGRFFNQKR